jgi:hypothetical protein
MDFDETRLHIVAARVADVGLTVARGKKKTKKTPKKTKKTKKTPKKTPKSKGRSKKSPKKSKKSPSHVSRPVETDITRASTEYACRADLSLSIDFEGHVGKSQLVKAFENNIRSSLKEIASTLARGFQLNVVDVKIGPMTVDCAVTDSTGIEEMLD